MGEERLGEVCGACLSKYYWNIESRNTEISKFELSKYRKIGAAVRLREATETVERASVDGSIEGRERSEGETVMLKEQHNGLCRCRATRHEPKGHPQRSLLVSAVAMFFLILLLQWVCAHPVCYSQGRSSDRTGSGSCRETSFEPPLLHTCIHAVPPLTTDPTTTAADVTGFSLPPPRISHITTRLFRTTRPSTTYSCLNAARTLTTVGPSESRQGQ